MVKDSADRGRIEIAKQAYLKLATQKKMEYLQVRKHFNERRKKRNNEIDVSASEEDSDYDSDDPKGKLKAKKVWSFFALFIISHI